MNVLAKNSIYPVGLIKVDVDNRLSSIFFEMELFYEEK